MSRVAPQQAGFSADGLIVRIKRDESAEGPIDKAAAVAAVTALAQSHGVDVPARMGDPAECGIQANEELVDLSPQGQ